MSQLTMFIRLEHTLDKLLQSLADLRTENKTLKEHLIDLKKERSNLKKELYELNASIEQRIEANDDYKRLQEENKQLHKERKEIKARIKQMLDKFNLLKDLS